MNEMNVKPMAEELARDLSQVEIDQIGGGMADASKSCTGKVTNGGDWEVSCTIDW